MSVPRKLLQEAFASLPEASLRRAAEHNEIRGRDKLSAAELCQRLAWDGGLHLQSYSSKLSVRDLKSIAKVFGIEHAKLNKEALCYAVWLFVFEYDVNRKQGKVVTLDDALARKTIDQQFYAVRERIATKLVNEAAYDTLRDGEKLLWQIDGLLCEVNNGGFHQYLTNSTGDDAQDTVLYLKQIGATTTYKLLKSIAAIFPDRIINSDRKKRCDYLEKWEKKAPKKTDAFFTKLDVAFYDRDEDLTALTLAYVHKNKVEFD